MKCPVCETKVLTSKRIDEHLNAHQCPSCTGVLIHLSDYLYYLGRHAALEEQALQTEEPSLQEDSKKAVICPNCHGLMAKYRLQAGSERKIDHCNSCQSIWLDGGEWEYLKTIGLHGVINKIFTTPWQRNIRLQNTEQAISANYQEKLGSDDYARLRETRAWMKDHPHKNMMIAYLTAANPYRTE